MAAYYNEIDPYAAAWLRNLIQEGHIAPGDVDERSIEDVRPSDLRGYDQCHFFAGIGGWSYALRLAGWPDDKPVWTGSCPCQPFSAAGKGAGFADERHLWPYWYHLIGIFQPPVIFGEQVAAKSAEPWLDLVHADLEALGYAFGAVPVPAAGVGAPHIRDRLWFVADAVHARRAERRAGAGDGQATGGGGACRLADANGGHACAEGIPRSGQHGQLAQDGGACGLAESDSAGRQPGQRNDSPARHGDTAAAARGDDRHESAGPTNNLWRDADWLLCRDGKWRPVEPGLKPLAHGIPNRVGRLRAYGNAIVPQVAAEFVKAYMEIA